MKKFLTWLLVLFSVFALFSCSVLPEANDESEKPNTNEVSDLENQQLKIYEKAKASGYLGSFEEWVAQIKGLAGINGKDSKPIELKILNSKLYWRYKDSDAWNELADLANTKGPQGKDGITISKILKTKTEGLADTYTIYYTDNTTSLIVVTNGKDATYTPTITVGANGNWFIDGVDTNIKTQGPKGDTGLSAYQKYLIDNPSYKGSEEEWIYDLVNGKLGSSIKYKPELQDLINSLEINKGNYRLDKNIELPKYLSLGNTKYLVKYESTSSNLTLTNKYDYVLAEITRASKDVKLTLTASITDNDLSYSKDFSLTILKKTSLINENGLYNDRDNVALYIATYHKLPKNYYNKDYFYEHYREWTRENKMSCGGDRFGNREGILPSGYNYIECDIDYNGGGTGNRGKKRIVYSPDNYNIYYTDDHYTSFVKLYDHGVKC